MLSRDEDRTFTRTDPIMVEMEFKIENLGEEGKEGLHMRGRAYPGVESGKLFGLCAPRRGPLKEQIDQHIEHQMSWLRNAYPKRPLTLKVVRPDCRQLTLTEVA